MSEVSITKLSFDFRSSHNLSPVEPINVRSLLYKLDILAVFIPLSREFSGMSIKTDKYRFMLINSGHGIGKQNFTICHELYHLFVQEDFSSMICSTEVFNKRNKVEFRADCFAADLLLPKFGILDIVPFEEKRFNLISVDTLLKIENYFMCSRSALLYRLKDMKLVDSDFINSNSKKVSKGALNHGYSTRLYKPTKGYIEVIGDYSNIAHKRFNEDLISESHFLDLLLDIGINLEENSDCKNVEKS